MELPPPQEFRTARSKKSLVARCHFNHIDQELHSEYAGGFRFRCLRPIAQSRKRTGRRNNCFPPTAFCLFRPSDSLDVSEETQEAIKAALAQPDAKETVQNRDTR